MVLTLEQIHQIVGGEIFGDSLLEISGISSLQEAISGQMTFLANSKYRSEVDKTAASAIILGQDISLSDISVKNGVSVNDPYYAFLQTHQAFANASVELPTGIDPTAKVSENVILGKNVSIQAHCVIENGVKIGEGTIIWPNTYVGPKVEIGSHVRIRSNVSIGEGVKIGDRTIIQDGVVIGGDGFGFATFEGQHHKIPQIGTVVIGDDVEIGANTTIDRATLTETSTVIGSGTKIDNLVQVAHNVKIGKCCRIAAQVGISGSTQIGDHVTIAGQVGIAGHLTIGSNNTVLAKSGVTKSLADNMGMVSGFPARLHREEMKDQAKSRRLGRFLNELQELKQKIADLAPDSTLN